MNGRLVFLLEEPSMKALLDGLLPRWFPGWVEREHFLCVPHEGKSDLDASIPRKLRAWKYPGDRFVVVRDNDNANCQQLKARLLQLCEDSGRPDTLVRLVCQELEAWYLGDLTALGQAYAQPALDSAAQRKRFSDPDCWRKPSRELQRLVAEFQKRSGARLMAEHMRDSGSNRSASYRAFETGVRRLAAELGAIG